jgi:DNA-binding MarR family transcriptional regulator
MQKEACLMDKQNLGYHFAQLHRLMLSLCKKEISQLGVKPSQIPFLATLLKADGAMIQDELSASLSIDKAATARALHQLEKQGFVFRKINPDNRRQKLVTASQKARDISDRFFAILQENSNVLGTNISNSEMATMLSLINRMMANAMNETHERLR